MNDFLCLNDLLTIQSALISVRDMGGCVGCDVHDIIHVLSEIEVILEEMIHGNH